MIFFDRKIEITVYTDTKAVTIKDLHMEINVLLRKPVKTKKAKHPLPNQAQVIIFNLAEATRGLFSGAHRGVDIKAGYGADLVLIFRGVTVNVLHEKFSTDWTTTIFASDGHKEWSTANFNKAYSGGTPILRILADLGAALGMPPQIDYSRADTLLVGTSFTGKVKDVLTSLCNSYELTWSIQRGNLVITDNLNPPLVNRAKAVVLSPTSGLIGSPVVQEESRNESVEKKKKKKKQVKDEKLFFNVFARSLLNPELFPGVPVVFKVDQPLYTIGAPSEQKVKPINFNDVFICDKVNHIGSNYMNDFLTEIETSERQL